MGGDWADLFGNLFGGGGSGAAASGVGGRRQRGPERGEDISVAVQLSFDDALKGVTTKISVPQTVDCDACRRYGAAPGTEPDRLSAVPGSG